MRAPSQRSFGGGWGERGAARRLVELRLSARGRTPGLGAFCTAWVHLAPGGDNGGVSSVDQVAAREPLRQPAPGPLWTWVKWVSWIELGIFAALCVFWLAPGYKNEELIFGLGHGIGYLALLSLILVAALRHQAPYVVLAASLTPVGPLGSVIAIEWIERKRPAYRKARA